MSFQINASYSEQLHFEGVAPRDLYAYLLKGIEAMGWTRGEITENTITAYHGLSITSFGEVIHMEMNHHIVEVSSTCLMPQLWSIGRNRRNIKALGRRLNFLMDTCSPGDLQRTYMTASAEFITAADLPGESARFKNVLGAASKISGYLSIFNPKPGYFITPILIDLNIIYFLLIGLAGGSFFPYRLHGFEYLGANVADLVLTRGQWWRLISYQFMHAGFLHLIGNLFTLLMIGVYLEPLLGRARFLLFYLICGISGGLLSIYIHPFVGSVGASGAILGLYGVFLALLTANLIEKHTRKAVLSTLVFFICLQLLAGITGPVDNSAHIGGLISGFLLGKIALTAIRREQSSRTAVRLTAIAVITAIAAALALKTMPNQADSFRKAIVRFSQNEIAALHYEALFGQVSDPTLIREIEYQSLGFWKQNAEVLDQLDALPIGKTGHMRVQKMRHYVSMEVKKASFTLLWLLHNRDIRRYEDSLQSYDLQLNKVLEDLSETPWIFQ